MVEVKVHPQSHRSDGPHKGAPLQFATNDEILDHYLANTSYYKQASRFGGDPYANVFTNISTFTI